MRRLKYAAAALIVLALPALCFPADKKANPSLDRGLRNNLPLSLSLAEKASEAASSEEKAALLLRAAEASPDVPGFYLKLSRAALPNPSKALGYYFEALKAYGANFWWSLSLSGLIYTCAVLSLALSMLIVGLIRFFADMPLLTHELNEGKAKLLVPLLLVPATLAGPLFFAASLLILSGLYMKRSSKAVVHIALVSLIFYPALVYAANAYFSASTPGLRAIAAVNKGFDNSYAIAALKDEKGFESRFSLAIALKREGRLVEAASLYNSITEARPEARLYNNLANAYFAAGETELAKETYKKALEIKPLPAVLYNLSQVYRDSLDFETGDRYYDEAVKLDGESVSKYTAAAGRHYNRFVMDITLSDAELWWLALRNTRAVLDLSNESAFAVSGVAAALFLLFLVLDKKAAKRAFRCSDCGRVICPACAGGGPRSARCRECHRLYKEDSSPRARVRRMLAANERRNRTRGVIKLLSFLPPGIAQAYAGRVLEGMVFLWAGAFCLLALILDPLFKTGMDGFGHGVLVVPLGGLFILLNVSSLISVNRRLESGWL